MKNLNKGKLLKSLLSIALLSTLFVSCGQDNKTGQSSRNSSIGSGIWGNVYNNGQYGGGNGAQLPSNFLDIIAQENTCVQGGQRSQAQITLNQNINAGSLYVGVTSYGDISVVQNRGGVATMTMYICPRAGLTGQGQLMQNPIVNISQACPVGEISRAHMVLTGQPSYEVIFRPIHIPNSGIRSSLCNSQYYY